ncbi:Mrp/NBP35 family ATP-binding protein [Woodsholea maritima]|uniref:Mrp/NBP35 family ATP-binding protein n=1 Tax=Woodsholea maritima TaxID=240237 RepID=UPI000365A2C1|nr:Mrp/NBP35 family ATP-binding protein [Woodsholea maritima]
MSEILKAHILSLRAPGSGDALIEPARLETAMVKEGVATLILRPGAKDEDAKALKAQLDTELTGFEGITRVRVIFEAPASGRPAKPRANANPNAPLTVSAKQIIAVASGKGGVGKSTVSANLAGALVKSGLKVGLMDADIYGPSVPRLFGLSDAPGLKKTDAGIQPLMAHGIKVVSMGFLVGDREPVVWRGPMVSGAVRQFLGDVDWGDLDVLIIDMPPGTGDIQLSLAQSVAVTGVVIVSTPQTLALDDARKAMALFEKTHIPILGLVENMSFYICPSCGDTAEIFGRGGVRDEAQLLGVPFLGEIPLHPVLRDASDKGELIALGEGPVAQAFARAAEAMRHQASQAVKPEPIVEFLD